MSLPILFVVEWEASNDNRNICMNSILAVFEFEANQGRYFVDEREDLWFALTDVLMIAKTSTDPAKAQVIIGEVFDDEAKIVHPIPDSMGRVQETIFIHESAFTFLVSRFRTETGKKLNRYIHKELLPTIRKTGGYISKGATKEQLEALHQQIEEQQKRIELLTTHAKILENQSDRISFIGDFLAANFVFTPQKYVMFHDVYARWKAWTGKETQSLFTDSEVFRTIDTYLKSSDLPKTKRFYIDKNGGYGDLENASLVPLKKAKDNAWSAVCGLGE